MVAQHHDSASQVLVQVSHFCFRVGGEVEVPELAGCEVVGRVRHAGIECMWTAMSTARLTTGLGIGWA